VSAGDIVVGLPSVGLQTNGYTLARKVFFEEMGCGPPTARRSSAAAPSATRCWIPTSRT
jgi:phosphoribosylaminoimidazole (AIR) synthetase